MRQSSFFTLIELLVVVAIIAVLASLLLPALSVAKAQARQALCLSQQKQSSTYLMLYADDSNAWFPRARSNDLPTPTPTNGKMSYGQPWGLLLVSTGYVGYPGDLTVNYEEAATIIQNNVPLDCPSIDPVPLSTTLHQWLQTYGLRELQYKTSRDWGNPMPVEAGRINMNRSYASEFAPADSPSSFPVGTDSTRQYPGSKWWAGRPVYEEAACLSYRATMAYEGIAYRAHRGRGNVWFLDGHAESLGQAEMKNLIHAGGDSSAAMDNNDDPFENSISFYF